MSFRRSRRLGAAALPLFLCAAVALPAAAVAPPRKKPALRPKATPATIAAVGEKLTDSAKYGVYYQGSRIGGMDTRTLELVDNKKPAVRMEARTQMKLTALGSVVEVKIELSHLMDPKGVPLKTWQVSESLGRKTSVTAVYQPDKVVCNLDAGGSKSVKVVHIPTGIKLMSDPSTSGLSGDKLAVGQKTTLHFFEPTTLSIIKMESEVTKEEMRDVAGKKVKAFLVVSSSSLLGESQSWVDKDGKLLENMEKLGIQMIREDVPLAGRGLSYQPPKDFAVATSVVTDVKLPEPRRISALRIRIDRIPDKSLILSDTRQRVQIPVGGDRPGAVSGLYDIQTRDLPARCLPLASKSDTGVGLGDAPFLGIADAEIVRQAAEIVGGETDRGVVARRIRSWVKAHMQKPNNVATPRAASEIMKSRDGVCRDYATLYTSLARAAGIPTRVCAGLVYFQTGFFYHAWAECRLTDEPDGWYAFDPTLEEDFVDATHVKFAQGDPIDMYASIRVVGQIKVDVIEFRKRP